MSSANARWRDSANCWNCTSYHACADAERAALGAKADQVVRISDKPIYVFQALVQYLETHRVVAPGYSFLQDLLTNCIYYNACILSELLERAERRQDYQRADAIKRANLASWKHVNLYGGYSFLDIGDGIDLQELVNLLEAARGRGAAAPD